MSAVGGEVDRLDLVGHDLAVDRDDVLDDDLVGENLTVGIRDDHLVRDDVVDDIVAGVVGRDDLVGDDLVDDLVALVVGCDDLVDRGRLADDRVVGLGVGLLVGRINSASDSTDGTEGCLQTRDWSVRGWERTRSSGVEESQHHLGEHPVDAEDQRGEEHERDEHDDRVVDRLGLGRPGDLAELAADLLDELTCGRALLLGLGARLGARACGTGSPSGPSSPCLRSIRFCSRFNAMARLSKVRVAVGAGQEGLEPPTAGFGDRCSTKLSYCPRGVRVLGVRPERAG